MQGTVHATRNGTVLPSELSAAGPSPERWLLLDVRTPGEFAGSHIEGSWNLPLGSLSSSLEAVRERARGRSVALVCRTGRRAEEAKRLLAAASLEDLRVLEGGVVAWGREGLALVHGDAAMSLERQVQVTAGSLIVFGVLFGLLVHPAGFWFAGLMGAGLVFSGLTNTCAMGMLLAKMPWNRGGAVCANP